MLVSQINCSSGLNVGFILSWQDHLMSTSHPNNITSSKVDEKISFVLMIWLIISLYCFQQCVCNLLKCCNFFTTASCVLLAFVTLFHPWSHVVVKIGLVKFWFVHFYTILWDEDFLYIGAHLVRFAGNLIS